MLPRPVIINGITCVPYHGENNFDRDVKIRYIIYISKKDTPEYVFKEIKRKLSALHPELETGELMILVERAREYEDAKAIARTTQETQGDRRGSD